ncbi:MAG: hypothetical protein ABJB05_15320 [Parafilimonas sp.]
MKEHNDAALSALIYAGKEATRELSNMKIKKQTPRMKELLVFRRGQLDLIRTRATELSMSESDLENIRMYIQDQNT